MRKNKVRSISVLIIYLIAGLYQSIAFGNASSSDIGHSHTHDDYSELHHEHHFHLGIFHFLKHVFENIEKISEDTDDHLTTILKHSPKKDVDSNNNSFTHLSCNGLEVSEVDPLSIMDPPCHHLFKLQQYIRSTSLLRGPPPIK